MDATTINQLLEALYLDALPAINSLILQNTGSEKKECIHGPFLMRVDQKYTQASKRILIVGMETHGWEPWSPVETPMQTYNRMASKYAHFTSTLRQPESPFWWFMEGLANKYGIENFTEAVLWSNLSKIDVEKSKPKGPIFDGTMQLFMELLHKEITIVSPELVIITTTNPDYNWHIKQYLGINRNPELKQSVMGKEVFRLNDPVWSVPTFQICHPNRLRFKSGGFWRNAEIIMQIIRQQGES